MTESGRSTSTCSLRSHCLGSHVAKDRAVNKPKQASSRQLTLGAFGTGSVATLDDGKRLRLDDKVDFWPGTGSWKVLSTGQAGFGVTSLFAFLEQERERVGQAVPKPVPIKTQRRVTCNYCGKAAQLHGGIDVYPHRQDLAARNFWVCWPCDAWVGCHIGGDGQQPLGELANEELRAARMSAHAAFDPLWKDGEMTRHEAYDWLSVATRIPRIRCRIGMMDADECRLVVAAVASRSDFP